MLAVMERGTQGAGPSSVAGSSSPSDPPIQEFLSSGRTGRRNALPDILGTIQTVNIRQLVSHKICRLRNLLPSLYLMPHCL